MRLTLSVLIPVYSSLYVHDTCLVTVEFSLSEPNGASKVEGIPRWRLVHHVATLVEIKFMLLNLRVRLGCLRRRTRCGVDVG